jgi:hypothetical protein
MKRIAFESNCHNDVCLHQLFFYHKFKSQSQNKYFQASLPSALHVIVSGTSRHAKVVQP